MQTDELYREAVSYVSHHKTSKHQCTRFDSVPKLNSQASSQRAFKDCRDLYARVSLWLVREWVRIPFAAIFTDITRG